MKPAIVCFLRRYCGRHYAQEILRLKNTTATILAEHTGKTLEQILEDSDRDFFMSAEEAVNYGIIDKVVTPTKGKSESK